MAAGLVVVAGAGAVIGGGTFVASAEGRITEFVLRLIDAFVDEGAPADAVNGAVGIDPGSLSFFVNAVPADL